MTLYGEVRANRFMLFLQILLKPSSFLRVGEALALYASAVIKMNATGVE